MTLTIIFVAVLVGLAAVFVFTHLRPLTPEEVEDLAGSRRRKQIKAYFVFSRFERQVDKEFKRRMNPNGRFYAVDEQLWCTPSIVAGLLKYKKHEWIVAALERNQRAINLWVNKGFDRTGVSLALPMPRLIGRALELGCTSVLLFHNHPNPDPRQFDKTRPSSQDQETADSMGRELRGSGLNLIEFVCERGRPHRYFASYADSFMPLQSFVKGIEDENGHSRVKNLGLHCERVFSL